LNFRTAFYFIQSCLHFLGMISVQSVFAWQGRSETPRIKTRHQRRVSEDFEEGIAISISEEDLLASVAPAREW